MHESLFDEEPEVAISDLRIVPYTLPVEFPKKQEIRTYRADLIEQLTGRMDPLDAYLMVKFIEKVLTEKDEGVVSLMKDRAKEAFLRRFGGSKTEVVRGATVSVKAQTRWEYPAQIEALERDLAVKKQELANAKKIAEVDGTARKFTDPVGTLSIMF